MALNCGERPPDPTETLPAGYLLMKKSSEMATGASQQVTPSTSNMQLTGSTSCNYAGISKSDIDEYKRECFRTLGYDSYAGGSCSSNIMDVAAKMGTNNYYIHHEMEAPLAELQMGSDHRPLQGAEGVIRLAAMEYKHPASGTHEIGQKGSMPSHHVQLRVGAPNHHCSYHEMELRSVLQLQGQSAAPSQLRAGANHPCSTHEELARSEVPQTATGTAHSRAYYDMSMTMTVQQRQDVDAPDHHRSLLGDSSGCIGALESVLLHSKGEADHHHDEREGHTAARGPLQYMKMSPEGSISMMSMEEQEGVYYGGSSAGGGAGGNVQMSAWDHYNMQGQEGQSLMMMKKRRLTNEQVKSLEVSFERESKLEAERKKELAQELGLQPRQVAVWFQNRRARFKTKQLEHDFGLLKYQYDTVRSEKDKLLAEVAKLKDLLDAQTAASEGKSLIPANETREKDHDMDEDTKIKHLSSESPEKQKATEVTEGTRKQNATSEAAAGPAIATRTGKQKVTSNQKVQSNYKQEHAGVLSSEKSDQTHVHAAILAMDQGPKSFTKGSFTLEVKPSLQVSHMDHYYCHHRQQQHQFPNTLSPPTNLSLCSPQQLFLHHMIAMKMEGGNLNLAQQEPQPNFYNDHYNFHHNQDGEDGSESMLCFNSTWYHDP